MQLDTHKLFKTCSFPVPQDLPLFGGLGEVENPAPLDASGSKFSRWFQGDSGGGAGGVFGGGDEDSRRSSINEGEFGYLNGEEGCLDSQQTRELESSQ